MSNSVEDSYTNLMTFEGRHTWTIQNWASWINCTSNPEGGKLYSDVFIIPVDNARGLNQPTRWQIMAFPKTINKVSCLAFRLICLDQHLVPHGSFYFCTYTVGRIYGKRIQTKFAPLPLDAAEHYSSCVHIHPEKNLTIGVKIKISCCEEWTRNEPANSLDPEDGLPSYDALMNHQNNQS